MNIVGGIFLEDLYKKYKFEKLRRVNCPWSHVAPPLISTIIFVNSRGGGSTWYVFRIFLLKDGSRGTMETIVCPKFEKNLTVTLY